MPLIPPVAILCGGYGTRAGTPNKCFQDVAGKPFVLHQLEWLERWGYHDATLLRGREGTLEALKRYVDLLAERPTAFLLLYGDTLTRVDLNAVVRAYYIADAERPCWGLTVRWDGEDAGISVVKQAAISYAHASWTRFEDVRDYWTIHGCWSSYESPVAWVEVGTPEALEEARRALA